MNFLDFLDFRVTDLIDILLVAVLLFYFYRLVRGTGVQTDRGLVAPVLRQVGRMDLRSINVGIAELVARADLFVAEAEAAVAPPVACAVRPRRRRCGGVDLP